MTQAMRMLLAEGLISSSDLERALALKAARGGTTSQHLVESGALDSDDLVRFLSRRFPVPRWTRRRLELVAPEVSSVLPAAHARSLRVIPVARDGENVTVAIADPTDVHALNETSRVLGRAPSLVLVSEADLSFALEKHCGCARQVGAADSDVPLPLVCRVAEKESGRAVDEREAIPLVRRLSRPVAPWKLECDSWSIGPSATISVESKPEAIVDAKSLENGTVASVEPPAPSRTLSEGELIAAIGEASDRDAVIARALEYLMRCADRAAFFAVMRGEIRGVRIVDGARVRSGDSARTLFLPLSAPSTLRRIAEEKQVYLGALDKTAADAVLSAALGGRPERVLVIPVVLREKTVGLLMADGFSSAMPPRARLERLSAAVADAFSKLIARGKLK